MSSSETGRDRVDIGSGGGRPKLGEEKPETIEATIGKQSEFWMGILSALGAKSATSVEELQRMDVFDFFALLSVIEKQSEKKK